MGRQAYLAKIAFGRSAFEPTQFATQSTEYTQLESSQSELPALYREATANNYLQLYDERGNPINPRSHGYGKKLRDAQNDVLASVGVVERRRLPSEGLPGSYAGRLDLLETEDTAGSAIAVTSSLIENLCTWWIGTIRDRILTFRYQDAVSFAQIVASEHAISGAALVYTGIAPRLLSTLSIRAVAYSAFVYQPIDRLLYLTRASSRTRNYRRRSKKVLESILRMTLDVLFYPFYYQASLQRLGLVPPEQLLPSWRSLIPFLRSSPLLPFSLHYDASASVVDCIKAALTSPIILVCVEHAFERWVYACIHEAVESSIIRPDYVDMQSRDAGDKDRATPILDLRRQSPPLVRDMIYKLLAVLGWGQPLASGKMERNLSTVSAQPLDSTGGQNLDVGDTRVTNLTPLELPVAQTQDQPEEELSGAGVTTIPTGAIDDMVRSRTLPSPTASVSDQDDNDPRIRITSREGIVEMEVRLPPRILSTHTEVADARASSPIHGASVSRNNASSSRSRSYHRVTELSTEPAHMISAVVKAQLVGLAMLPMKLVVLRLVAAHYLASQGGYVGPPRIIPSLNNLTWRSIGIQISRIAFCGTLELTIDLGLWGLQYLAVTRIGRSFFEWGTH